MKLLYVLTIILVVTGLSQIVLALYAGSRKPPGAVRVFVSLMTAMALYTLGHAMELNDVTLPGKLFWSRVQYIGIPFIPPLYLLVCLNIAGLEGRVRGWKQALLFPVPMLTSVMAITNSFHCLYYASWSLGDLAGIPVLILTRGPFYYVHMIYSTIMFITMAFLAFRYMSWKNHLFRAQAMVILSGSVLAWLVYAVYLGGFVPRGLDINPLGFSAISFLLAVALFRYRLFDILPVARESVLDQMPDGFIVFDMADRLVDFNPSASSVIPTLERDALGKAARDVLSVFPDALRALDENLPDVLSEAVVLDEVEHYYRCRLTSVMDRSGKMYGRALILSDVTEQIMLLRQMTVFASYDFLTGVHNRRYFIESCEREISRAKRTSASFSVIMMDLDHFKKVNDTYGHDAGDWVLKSAVDRCRECLRGSDIMGRWGGEEFALFLAETLPSQGEHIAERLRAAIASSVINHRGVEIRVTASFGVTGSDGARDERLEDMIRVADSALYRAKTEGRDRVVLLYP